MINLLTYNIPHNGHAGFVFGELVQQLALDIERVVLNDDAESQHSVEGDDVLRATRQNKGNPVARFHPQLASPRGGALNPLRRAVCRSRCSQRTPAPRGSEPLGAHFQRLWQRQLDRINFGANTLGIRGQPGAGCTVIILAKKCSHNSDLYRRRMSPRLGSGLFAGAHLIARAQP